MNLEKILIIPDVHCPYHDKKAVKLLLTSMKEFKPDHLIVMGDALDLYSVSSHSKNPQRSLKLKWEIDETVKLLEEFKALGAKNNVFIEGNHENRLVRYLQDKAPELYDYVSIPKILELDRLKFKFVQYKDHYQLGKLNLTHDTGTAGRYAHYKSLDAFQHNVVIGHVHRMGYVIEGNAQGTRHLGASFGWLGDIEHIDYMHKVKATRDWSLGFGIGYLDTKTKNVYLVPVPIIDYSCLVEGKLYKV